MRTEIRQVVTEQEVYVADDGTEFTNRDDCEEHEVFLIGTRLKMYDYKFTKTTDVDDCWYVHIRTEYDAKSFITMCGYICVSSRGIDVPGVYMYTDKEWVNISSVVKRLEESEENLSGN